MCFRLRLAIISVWYQRPNAPELLLSASQNASIFFSLSTSCIYWWSVHLVYPFQNVFVAKRWVWMLLSRRLSVWFLFSGFREIGSGSSSEKNSDRQIVVTWFLFKIQTESSSCKSENCDPSFLTFRSTVFSTLGENKDLQSNSLII